MEINPVWQYLFLSVAIISAISIVILQFKREPYAMAFEVAPRILALPGYWVLNFWFLSMRLILCVSLLLSFIFLMRNGNLNNQFISGIAFVMSSFSVCIEINNRRKRFARYKKHFEDHGS